MPERFGDAMRRFFMNTNTPKSRNKATDPASGGPLFDAAWLNRDVASHKSRWDNSPHFRHVVVDDFLPEKSAALLSERFPPSDHPVWLDWKTRSPSQYGKQGPGNSDRFETLDWWFLQGLQQFNNWIFLQYLETVTSIEGLLPDPYFTGGGMHQILHGGILDVHTDFNDYDRLKVYRRLNVLLYLTLDWEDAYGGALELWDKAPSAGGRCFEAIPPLFNRLVVFETDKTSFHGHPREWKAPDGLYRHSIALYYYTAEKAPDKLYDDQTDFQNFVTKPLPTD